MKRRDLFESAAAGVAGGLVGPVGTASARGIDPGTVETPPDVDESSLTDHDGTVSTRDHYYVSWFHTVRRESGVGEFEYEIGTSVPGFDSPESPEELVVFAHGWQVNDWVADVNFAVLADTLGEYGYEHPVVGFEWDAVTSVFDWWEAIEIAKRNGKKLGRFLADYRAQNPDTTIRLMGHSLGAQVALSTVARLEEYGWVDLVDSLTLLGAAVDDEVVAEDATYGPPIARLVGRADNFHSENDHVLELAYPVGAWNRALGTAGVEGQPTDNYADHEVDYVATHYHYFLADGGCLHEVVQSWRPETGDGTFELTGSIPTTGLSRTHTYRLEDADAVEVTLEGPQDADFDLYLTLDGRTPTTTDYDRRSVTDDATESVTVEKLEGTTLGIRVSSYAGTGEYSVVIDPS